MSVDRSRIVYRPPCWTERSNFPVVHSKASSVEYQRVVLTMTSPPFRVDGVILGTPIRTTTLILSISTSVSLNLEQNFTSSSVAHGKNKCAPV